MLLGVPGRVAGRCVSICLVAICGMSARGDNKPIPGRISVICQVSSLLLQSAVSWPDRDVRPDMTAGVVCGHWSLATNIQSAPGTIPFKNNIFAYFLHSVSLLTERLATYTIRSHLARGSPNVKKIPIQFFNIFHTCGTY